MSEAKQFLEITSYPRRAEHGFSVLELLVSLLISSAVLSSVLASFMQMSRLAVDQKLKLMAQLQAQSVVDMLVPELRMIGNGVPFHQANFLIDSTTLSDNTVTQPVLASGSTSSQIQFRINETGEMYVLSSSYTPSVASGTISLTSVTKIKAGDIIYISNSVVDYDDGLYGVVNSVDSGANTITINTGTYVAIAGAVFQQGSILEVVPTITYNSAADWSGITRDSGTGAVLLAPNSQMSLQYLDSTGTVMTLPLVAATAEPYPANGLQNLRLIKITIQVRTSTPLYSTGAIYTATAEQTVAIRNFNYSY